MQLITITTDLGFRDPYLAMVKGLLYKKIPSAHVIDVSCNVNKHAHGEGAFALKSALPYFEENTIHLFAVKLLLSTGSTTDSL